MFIGWLLRGFLGMVGALLALALLGLLVMIWPWQWSPSWRSLISPPLHVTTDTPAPTLEATVRAITPRDPEVPLETRVDGWMQQSGQQARLEHAVADGFTPEQIQRQDALSREVGRLVLRTDEERQTAIAVQVDAHRPRWQLTAHTGHGAPSVQGVFATLELCQDARQVRQTAQQQRDAFRRDAIRPNRFLKTAEITSVPTTTYQCFEIEEPS